MDDHESPVLELERLLKVFRAYEHMNNGDLAVETGDMEQASQEYGAAEAMFPENLEMKYWHAITLANNQQLDQAIEMLKPIFKADQNWWRLTQRLPEVGLLEVSEQELQLILDLAK
ncbi:MAG: tetratricopeptide repeat protein [Cyclobacteriaceae bacterium]